MRHFTLGIFLIVSTCVYGNILKPFVIDELNLQFISLKTSPSPSSVKLILITDTEVTNKAYQLYLKVSNESKGDEEEKILENSNSGVVSVTNARIVDCPYVLWKGNDYPEGLADHPVVMVSVRQAVAFCDWLNAKYKRNGVYRLPYYDEWYSAAYGDGRDYPWGNEFVAGAINIKAKLEKHPMTETVRNRRTGVSPDGLFGLWGNVSELVIPRGTTPWDKFGVGNTQWVGGSFKDVSIEPRQSYWGYLHGVDNRLDDVGFRIVFEPND
jgi:formylglycine-generating enzyme required for sulfatase activity